MSGQAGERNPLALTAEEHSFQWTDIGAACSCGRWSVVALPNHAASLSAHGQHGQHVIWELRERLAAIEALADEWDAKLRTEHKVGKKYTDWHSRELRAVLRSALDIATPPGAPS